MFCSIQLGNYRQMDLSGPGIDVKLKERKKERFNYHLALYFHSQAFPILIISIFSKIFNNCHQENTYCIV
jgi:hypothetical protein